MKKLSLLVFILLLSLTACGTSTPALTQPPAQQSTPEPAPVSVEPSATPVPVVSTAVFQVVKADGSKFDVTLDALKKLPLASITVDGKVQEGPKLMDVLNLAGVTDFAEVTLTGSASPVTLTREQVDDNTILDFNNHGTLKLATTYVPMPDWTKDVSEITVK
jgi:predicted small lipoprotein YifL